MSTSEAKSPDACDAPKTTKIGVLAPMSIILFIALTLVGTYYVRLRILERAMVDAMEIGDEASVAELARSLPSPVNARDSNGRSPLHWAIESGSCELVEELLTNGADVKALGRRTMTGLEWESLPGTRHRPTVGSTLSLGAVSPLCMAAYKGRTDVARLLIANGAPLDWGCDREEDGVTPLDSAVSENQAEMAEMLLKAGAKVEGASGDFLWPLLAAVANGRSEIVRLLLVHSASVARADQNGDTVLHWAVGNQETTCVELLLGKGASANARNTHGQTPLHVAAEEGRDDLAERLLLSGASVSVKDNDGKTPLRLAIEKKHDSVAEVLRKAGAKE